MNVRFNSMAVTPGFETIYSDAVELSANSRVLTVSGQIGRRADGSVPASFEEQFRLAIANLNAVLAVADMGITDIVKLTFYLTRAADLEALGQVRRELLAVAPAVTTLVISGLAAPNLLVEVEAIAAVPR